MSTQTEKRTKTRPITALKHRKIDTSVDVILYLPLIFIELEFCAKAINRL